MTAIVLSVIFLCMPLAATAEEDKDRNTISFVMENDIFHSDRYYTNGVRASWLLTPGKKSDWALRAAGLVPFFPAESTVHVNYSVGQNMYTPTDITLQNPPTDDRPYAGWLYGSVGLIAETGKRLDQIELTVGVVGPASFADETQTFVHKTIHIDEPQGWSHQLKNEPGFILTYQRSWRSYVSTSWLGVPFDITPHAGGVLGNIFTYANTGVTLRYGKKLPSDYGPPRIQPSLPSSGFFVPKKGFGWYLFAGVEGRAVARNIFLDGNTFRDSDSVKKEPLVGDFQTGLVLTMRNVRIAYTHVIRSREFKAQISHRQDFGAGSLSMQF
ncbi:MAG: lipid A deacylase LpxR family protein [Deferribacterales bacterium]